jgi:RHS repeat-associated protein
LSNRGWRTKSEQIIENNQEKSGLKTLSIKAAEEDQVTVVKSFNIPMDFPFDVSDKTFEIRYNDSMYDDSAAYDEVYPGHGGHGPSSSNFYSSSANTSSNSTPGISRTSELFNTYYIYTYDGKLLAEYDHNGNCTRDYIYFGNRLIAEYKPQTNEYFYYMTDQINSTRIVLNDNGDLVFFEAYGPYGDIQKIWTNTYNPKLKFSGKEREGYSDLDYFGARYYDHKSYRFNSVDPVINKIEAFYNPQAWNLYAYCNNNPITYMDPDGRDTICSTGNLLLTLDRKVGRDYAVNYAGEMALGYTETIATEIVGIKIASWAVKGFKAVKRVLKAKNSKWIKKIIQSRKKLQGLRKQLKLHKKKLKQYRKNPDLADNKGLLKNADPERRKRIIEGRIKNLEKQINNFKNQIKEGK